MTWRRGRPGEDDMPPQSSSHLHPATQATQQQMHYHHSSQQQQQQQQLPLRHPQQQQQQHPMQYQGQGWSTATQAASGHHMSMGGNNVRPTGPASMHPDRPPPPQQQPTYHPFPQPYPHHPHSTYPQQELPLPPPPKLRPHYAPTPRLTAAHLLLAIGTRLTHVSLLLTAISVSAVLLPITIMLLPLTLLVASPLVVLLSAVAYVVHALCTTWGLGPHLGVAARIAYATGRGVVWWGSWAARGVAAVRTWLPAVWGGRSASAVVGPVVVHDPEDDPPEIVISGLPPPPHLLPPHFLQQASQPQHHHPLALPYHHSAPATQPQPQPQGTGRNQQQTGYYEEYLLASSGSARLGSPGKSQPPVSAADTAPPAPASTPAPPATQTPVSVPQQPQQPLSDYVVEVDTRRPGSIGGGGYARQPPGYRVLQHMQSAPALRGNGFGAGSLGRSSGMRMGGAERRSSVAGMAGDKQDEMPLAHAYPYYHHTYAPSEPSDWDSIQSLETESVRGSVHDGHEGPNHHLSDPVEAFRGAPIRRAPSAMSTSSSSSASLPFRVAFRFLHPGDAVLIGMCEALCRTAGGESGGEAKKEKTAGEGGAMSSSTSTMSLSSVETVGAGAAEETGETGGAGEGEGKKVQEEGLGDVDGGKGKEVENGEEKQTTSAERERSVEPAMGIRVSRGKDTGESVDCGVLVAIRRDADPLDMTMDDLVAFVEFVHVANDFRHLRIEKLLVSVPYANLGFGRRLLRELHRQKRVESVEVWSLWHAEPFYRGLGYGDVRHPATGERVVAEWGPLLMWVKPGVAGGVAAAGKGGKAGGMEPQPRVEAASPVPEFRVREGMYAPAPGGVTGFQRERELPALPPAPPLQQQQQDPPPSFAAAPHHHSSTHLPPQQQRQVSFTPHQTTPQQQQYVFPANGAGFYDPAPQASSSSATSSEYYAGTPRQPTPTLPPQRAGREERRGRGGLVGSLFGFGGAKGK
ncbi:hypothetical protein HDU96_000434 [Phlyctochytrium bullatum]|nr:hypothetical protein HDU96_000434 [Phlyctochytrium bullatum]